MSKAVYDVIDGVTRKVKKQYFVVDGVTRKIKKSYEVVDGITRQFYSAELFKYTGDYTQSQVTIDGVLHDLYTLTSSGVLTLSDETTCKYWLCGSGAGGGNAVAITYRGDTAYSGPGGGGGYVASGEMAITSMVVEIGAGGDAATAGNTTTFGDISAAGGAKVSGRTGGKGGSGGGGGNSATGGTSSSTTSGNSDVTSKKGSGGTGGGVSTYPFGLTGLYAHCAGGSGGNLHYDYDGESTRCIGGKGGTNGGDGNAAASGNIDTIKTAIAGGVKGGGKGGTATYSSSSSGSATKGGAATFYGSGGGGGGLYCPVKNTINQAKDGGSGYQGVVYIAIPAA